MKNGFRVIYESDSVKFESVKTGETVAEGTKATNDICCLYFKVIVPEANVSEVHIYNLYE